MRYWNFLSSPFALARDSILEIAWREASSAAVLAAGFGQSAEISMTVVRSVSKAHYLGASIRNGRRPTVTISVFGSGTENVASGVGRVRRDSRWEWFKGDGPHDAALGVDGVQGAVEDIKHLEHELGGGFQSHRGKKPISSRSSDFAAAKFKIKRLMKAQLTRVVWELRQQRKPAMLSANCLKRWARRQCHQTPAGEIQDGYTRPSC